MSHGFAKDFGMLMILRGYDLVPGTDCFVGGLFSQLLRHRGLGKSFRCNNADI